MAKMVFPVDRRELSEKQMVKNQERKKKNAKKHLID
jgi:hypothetical protein